MRVNIYDEEITSRIEILEKTKGGKKYTGVRFYLELPVTVNTASASTGTDELLSEYEQVKGPFVENDSDCSGAVTFWTTGDPREFLKTALVAIEKHLETKQG